jgi:hypothetical protein
MTVGLRADFRIAHCAPISFGPTRYSPSLFLPSAVSFTVTTDLPPSGKKSRTHHTLGSALVSRSGGPTIHKFAQAYKSHQKQYGVKEVERKLAFELIGNRPVHPNLTVAVQNIASDTPLRGEAKT